MGRAWCKNERKRLDSVCERECVWVSVCGGRFANLGRHGQTCKNRQPASADCTYEDKSCVNVPFPASSWCQFNQHFMRSFYTRRSQKHKNDSQVISLFALLGSVCTKALCKILMKLTPSVNFTNIIWAASLWFFTAFLYLQFGFVIFGQKIDARKLLVKWAPICDVIYSSLCSYTRTRAMTSRRRWTSCLMLNVRNISQWNSKDGNFHGKPMKPWVNRYATSLRL